MDNNSACIYVRVSSGSQDETNQIPVCKQYAKELGLTVADIIQEKVSAFKVPERSSVQKLLNYPHVILFSYDRLYRNRKKFIEMMRYFFLKGVKIHSVRERWLEQFYSIPEPWGEILRDFMTQVVGWMSEDESKKKSERVKLAYQNKDEGIPWGRKNKVVDMERLKECYDPHSLRKTAKAYNEIFRGENRISYNTVKKIKTQNPGLFHIDKAVNQRNDCFTEALNG